MPLRTLSSVCQVPCSLCNARYALSHAIRCRLALLTPQLTLDAQILMKGMKGECLLSIARCSLALVARLDMSQRYLLMAGLGTNEDLLIEVICTRTTEELKVRGSCSFRSNPCVTSSCGCMHAYRR